MKDVIRDAFFTSASGYSPDRVLADSALNSFYITACRNLGLQATETELNLALLGLRKRGELRSLKSRRSNLTDLDEYSHAAEIAARMMEVKHQVSLDRMLCDPTLAVEFDQLAASFAPGYDSFRYRWAALGLRKKRSLKPELTAHIVPQEIALLGRLHELDLSKVPMQQGIYLFHTQHTTLYVGEAENLQNRLRKHLDHSDNRELARWLWQNPLSEAQIEIRALAASVSARVRRAVEAELIASRKPLFNIAMTGRARGKS